MALLIDGVPLRDRLSSATPNWLGHEEVVWAKLRAMSDGARLASARLWGR
jgi:hypothetical protein